MAKKKGKKGKKGNQRPQKRVEEDDFDPLKDAVIDEEFAIPTASKKKNKHKPKKVEKKEAESVPVPSGPLSNVKSKAKLYKITEESIAMLEEEGMEDGDLPDMEEGDLVEMGLSAEQAAQLAKLVRGDPADEEKTGSPLSKLRGCAQSHGIADGTFETLEREELTDEDLADLESSDLVDMGLSHEQAAAVVAAVKGEPAPAAAPKKLKLLREKAEEFKIDDAVIDVLAKEDLDDDDLFDLEKDDYKSMGLKIGKVIRIMKAVKALKAEREATKPETTTAPEPKPTSKPASKPEPEPTSKLTEPKPSAKKTDNNDDPFSEFAHEKPKEEKLSKAQLKRRRQRERAAAEAKGGKVGDKEGDQPLDPSKMSKKQLKKYKQRLKKEEEAKRKAAALAKLKAEAERRKREEEERQRQEKLRREEEKRKAEEEARRQAEEELRRKEEKKRRRREMKKAGLILTKKQKEEKKRREAAARRLAEQRAAQGLPTDTSSTKRPIKRRPKPKSKKLLALLEAEARRKAAEEAEAARQAAEESAAAKAKKGGEEDGEDGGWEAEADEEGGWEAEADEEDGGWEAEADDAEQEEKEQEEANRKAEEEAKREAERKAKEQKKKLEDEKKKAAEEKASTKKTSKKGKKTGRSKGDSKKKRKDNRELRSPICCILGHVDTGKTKLLDKMRSTNVQDREAGGITQQIGATYFPMKNIEKATEELVKQTGKSLNAKIPGLLMIDTPGHESFTNLRARGSNLCDIAILVVDIMHLLEPQTLESIRLLKERKTPFIVALNKVDRLFEWKSTPNGPIRQSLKNQAGYVKQEFDTRTNQVIAAFAKEAEINTCLYYKNKDYKVWNSLVPTSAHTGEGIPDLLWLLVKMTQTFMRDQIAVSYSDLQCTVLEVKKVEGLGTTIDVVLVNGILREGDTIVVCGLQGPIVTSIRALLTPPPMREIRVKAEYIKHKQIKAAMGVKITANGLEHAVAGTQLLVCGPRDDIEDLKDESMADLASILSRVDPSGQGVYVQASTLGSLEALLQFLEDSKVPVSGVAIGPVHKKDVMKAAVMREHREEYAVILAFDVSASPEAKQMAAEMGVTIFTANIIYHLFDMVTKYFDDIRKKRRAEAAPKAVFPCILKIIPEFVFNKRSPIVVGVEVVEGILRKGTPLVITDKNPHLDIGTVTSIELEHKEKTEAKKGEQVCIKIEQNRGNQIILLGRHFNIENPMISKLSRESIRLLKENFKEDLEMEDWKLVVKLKKTFGIIGKA
ncbi:hypothetical protein AAMO2058_001052100 [Amorphochlora amoebiformis]